MGWENSWIATGGIDGREWIVMTICVKRGLNGDDKNFIDIARTVRCPTCRGQSVLESDSVASIRIREDICDGVKNGATRKEIIRQITADYGKDIIDSQSDGIMGSVLWMLPIILVACCLIRWKLFEGHPR